LSAIVLRYSRLKRVHAIGMATAAASSVNLDRFAAQLEAAKARFEANKKEKKLAVLKEHQGKAFARFVKRAAREEREEGLRATIKAMQLRIEALERVVGSYRAQEVQTASEEEEKREETPRGER
jgi:GNAT superfamily N-acetyltransferase